ncbi:hypothetical protein CHO01_17210 [Cellulomonas hominis]|uniref:Uncharacterized protein n=1 Tax=Cellulomonas hominis TaxID=156981 RepID=A0A511FBK8_9CELL|nr:hypothetical protein CHO01_17210 [Cellulomonas hominis]
MQLNLPVRAVQADQDGGGRGGGVAVEHPHRRADAVGATVALQGLQGVADAPLPAGVGAAVDDVAAARRGR